MKVIPKKIKTKVLDLSFIHVKKELDYDLL